MSCDPLLCVLFSNDCYYNELQTCVKWCKCIRPPSSQHAAAQSTAHIHVKILGYSPPSICVVRPLDPRIVGSGDMTDVVMNDGTTTRQLVCVILRGIVSAWAAELRDKFFFLSRGRIPGIVDLVKIIQSSFYLIGNINNLWAIWRSINKNSYFDKSKKFS